MPRPGETETLCGEPGFFFFIHSVAGDGDAMRWMRFDSDGGGDGGVIDGLMAGNGGGGRRSGLAERDWTWSVPAPQRTSTSTKTTL